MKAAVYRGPGNVRVEDIPLPPLEPGEVLLKVEICGVCGTDLKKIAHGDLSPPRIFGHEVAGKVVSVGNGVTQWRPGDRATFFHHIPCRLCDLCQARAYAQCPQYLKVGTTAGFEPAGGGFSEFVKVKDWITGGGGLIKIPEGVEPEEAAFVEPVNTALKGIEKAAIRPGQSVLIFGSGPVGLILLQLARLKGAKVFVTDLIPERLQVAKRLGATDVFPIPAPPLEKALKDASGENRDCDPVVLWAKERIDQRGADVALVATASPQAIGSALQAVRPAGKVVLFAQTRLGETAPIDVGHIGKLEKELIGSYSASVDLQEEAARLIFTRTIEVKPLITHRFPLEEIKEALRVAMNPSANSLKVMIQFPQDGMPP